MGRPMTFARDEAIGKALDVFWVAGFAATTPQDLLDGLGIGKGSLYHAFDSKRGLYDLALGEYVRRRSDFLRSMLRRPGPRLKALAGAADVLVGLDDPLRNGCFVVNAVAELGHDEHVAKSASEFFAFVESEFRVCLEQAAAAGEIDAGLDTVRAAAQLLAVVMGASVLMRAGVDRAAVRKTLRGALDPLALPKHDGARSADSPRPGG